MTLVLLVDAANVVGSRPDGWWRDRAGAATRLRDRLAALVAGGVDGAAFGLPGRQMPVVRLVVEGAAGGVRSAGGVEVVTAEHDGDTTIVRLAEAARPDEHTVVVTADRELRSRVTAAGAAVVGPRTLLDLL
ncbi:hypothetical protein [Amycolatopsis suaedae]|uniref:NTP pyrophosphohydrolase n=1 Tax=Amycolatopsis suaedae TaxID=2510978 RepID=A0A4Q7J6E6_9PSEU|nr:hypothetical protein [Amycolatopsis suaedae]RZQ63191.1 hypothetical protein EWH70_16060 [Amycolatopsis suaedae]